MRTKLALCALSVLSACGEGAPAGGGAGTPAQSVTTPPPPVSQSLVVLPGTQPAGGAGATGVKFSHLGGVAADQAGNVYVTDACAIRKVTPAGVVTTLVGGGACDLALPGGGVNDAGQAATSLNFSNVTVDANGNVYVADINTIRKVTPAGALAPLAGRALSTPATGPSVDGTGDAASFEYIHDIAMGPDGNVLVADETYYPRIGTGPSSVPACKVADGYESLRTVTPQGVVTTLPGTSANCDESRRTLLTGAHMIRYDARGNLYLVHPAGIVRHGSAGDATIVPAAAYRNGGPIAIAPDGAGNLYYLTTIDAGVYYTIVKVAPDGTQTDVFSTRRDAPADIRTTDLVYGISNLAWVGNHDFVLNAGDVLMRVTLK
jgi:hypothetical protein